MPDYLSDVVALENGGHAIETLFRNESHRKRMGGAGRKAIKEKYNYRKQYGPVINQFDEWFNRRFIRRLS